MLPQLDEERAKSYDNVKIKNLQLGVWALRIEQSLSFQGPQKLWADVLEVVPFLWRLAQDIFTAVPFYSVVYLLSQLTEGLEDLILLGMSDRLLQTVEKGLVSGKPDLPTIFMDILFRIGFALLFAVLQWYSLNVRNIMHTKVMSHFQLLLIKANMRLDLASSQEAASMPTTSAREAWDAVEGIVRLVRGVIRTGSQMAFIVHISRTSGGPLFVMLCLSHPLMSSYLAPRIWDEVMYGYISNLSYRRVKALEKFADGKMRQDIISGGLADWIASQYERSLKELGNVSTMHPFYQDESRDPILKRMFLSLIDLSPMLYCTVNAAFNPLRFSVSSVAILQQSSTQVRYSVQHTLLYAQMFKRSVVSLKNLYKIQDDALGSTEKGIIPYPSPHANPEETAKGMSFELSDVSFSYPGAQSKTPALKGVSLNIRAGQLVVIVGANGGGKSTLIRILSRLYDPSSGDMHIDGRSSKDYIVSDLHQATALLSQDNQLYPLSLSENIGLGYPDRAHDSELVKQAAEEGGAAEFIEKLKDGVNTILEPILDVFQVNLHNNKEHVLYKEMEQLRKKIDVSGGERQKVVAARSFMRFRSGNIKFVAVDEPSSALDAEAELKLFQNLIKMRYGKTMVFVTHRFGHLTRYADQIICMKDGSVFESGSHDELMAKQGEYAKLYEIQASAFAQT